ncbi:tail length tape measure protein [Arthrobacter phage SilentRX]|uniref:Tape measure protein n=1 Tax=Arthrobacter phage SilentRX TaxID=2836091 RepID=A0A8F3E7E3_9CAUD|nr:tail length tape measure protein [Arthrobacter phage SilentRX]QWY82771.1 tape measure protein [Arthrobacter phage SilentRX]
MGRGREVGDAYISVHGDLSDFRNDLNKANQTMKDWAEENAQEFKDAWGDRMQQDWSRQWNSLVDSMYSGTKVDFNRMIETFDPSDLDSANEKINEMVNTMRDLGKISDERSKEMLDGINNEIKALQKQQMLEKNMAEDRAMWDKAHTVMMSQLADARDKASREEKAMWEEAIKLNSEYDYRRRKTMEEAIRDNARWARSFEGLTKNANLAQMESDFRSVVEAMRQADFSGFAKGFDTFTELRRRVSEVTAAMYEQGRMSEENARQAIDSANAYIQGEEDKAKATRDALDAAREAREEQERFKRSLDGMIDTVHNMNLEKDFRDLAYAIDSGDWSNFARGTKNMEELRIKTMQTAEAMRDMGRVTGDQFDWIGRQIQRVAADQDHFNLSFDTGSRKVRDFSGAIDGAHRTFGRMFALTKGFREHLGGFAGVNVFGDMIRQGLDFIHNLDRIALSSSIATTKLTTMASVGGGGMLSLITIAGDLGTVLGGLGAVLPGFLVGAGIQIGVLVAAFKDMKTVLADLTPAFAGLQDTISAKFWAQAADPIRDMVTTLMPTLTTQLGGTATALGGVFAAAATAIKNIPVPYLEEMFSSMNKGIEIAGGAMAPLINTFVTLGLAAAKYFERFGTWLVTLSTDLNNFINAAASDGRLLGWIDGMIEGFKNIGRAIDGTFGIFNALDDAASAAGFGGLKTFADNLQGMAAAMQSAGAQTALTQLFSGMLILVTKVGEALGKLGDPLMSIMPTINLALSAVGGAVATVIGYIGQVMANPTVQQGITDFTNGIAAAVDALAPAIAPFAQSLGTMMSLLGQIIVNVANIATAFTVVLGPVLDQISAQFETLVKPLGDTVVNLITQLGPVAQAINDNLVGPIVSGIRDYILPGFNSMIETLAPIAAQMVAALGPVLQSLLPLIPPIMELATTIGTVLMQAVIAVAPFFSVLVAAITPIVDAIVQLVNMIAPYLVPAISAIAAAVSPVVEVLGQVVGFILSVLVPVLGVLIIGVINNVVGVFQGLSSFIMGFVQIVTSIFTGFGQFFTKLFKGDIGGALGALGTMFKGIWDGIVKMLQGALQFLWNAVQLLFIGKLVGGIRTALTGVSGFFTSIWNSIVGFVKGAMGNINGTVTGILNGMKGFINGALNTVLGFFRTVWTNIGTAVSNGINGMMGFVRGIPGKISSALSGLGNLLVNAGNAIINGLLEGLKAAWGGVTSFVGGIAQWIADHKGPIPYDRKLLIPAGQAIMQGLGAGLEGQMSNLLDTVNKITDGLTNAVTDAFAHSKMYLAGADAALGLADGLDSKKSRVAASLADLTPDTTLAARVTTRATAAGGVGIPTPAPTKIINVHEGAVKVVTPTQSPELVASKVIDELVIGSNL